MDSKLEEGATAQQIDIDVGILKDVSRFMPSFVQVIQDVKD